MAADNERWLTDGDCKMCRRKDYCSKACGASKRRMQRQVHEAMNNVTGGMLDYMLERYGRVHG